MSGYYRTIPEYIASDSFLTWDDRGFYSLISALAQRRGFCWATNKYLAQEFGASVSTVKRRLAKLIERGYIHIEIEYKNDRKIWMDDAWRNKDKIEKVFGLEENPNEPKINQRFDRWFKGEPGGGSQVNRLYEETLYIESNYKKKHIEAQASPIASDSPSVPKRQEQAQEPMNPPKTQKTPRPPPLSHAPPGLPSKKDEPERPEKLKAQMVGPPPTPGSPKMADETADLLTNSIKIGTKRYYLHPSDIQWFTGFSPTIVSRAIDIASRESWGGKRIAQIVPFIFKTCCNIRKNQS